MNSEEKEAFLRSKDRGSAVVVEENQASTINSALAKSELVETIGREIDRLDRAAQASGYTQWAGLAAVAVMGWKALELFSQTAFQAVASWFVFLWLIVFLVRRTVGTLAQLMSGAKGTQYFRYPLQSAARIVALSFFAATNLALACVTYRLTSNLDWYRLFPVAFFGLVAFALFAMLLASKLPIPDGNAARVASIGEKVVGYLLSSLHFASIIVLFELVKLSDLTSGSLDLKAAILLVASYWLCMALLVKKEAHERSEHLRRLELEVALETVDSASGRERFQTLMLGLTAQSVLKPWIEEVVLPLDDAQASLAEAESLIQLVESSGKDGSAELAMPALRAMLTSAISLLDAASCKLTVADKAGKLLNIKASAALNRFLPSKDVVNQEVAKVSGQLQRVEKSIVRMRESTDTILSSIRQR